MTARRIDHVGITVSNLDRALEFYRDALGLELLGRTTLTDGDTAALLGLEEVTVTIADLDSGDGRVVELLHYASPLSRQAEYSSWHFASAHIAFTVDDLRATKERLERAGAQVISSRALTIHDPGGRWDGATCLYVRDPDGTILELVERPS